jgi:Replication initiator protein A
MQQDLLPLENQQALQRVVRIEKNLNSLGFFSPSSKIKNTKKVISIVRELPGGIKIEAKATIVGHETGLPNTADLDKYLAFQLIVAELKKKHGILENPVGFTTYQLLKLLGLKPVGKRYKEVEEWLDRMSATWIKSEGAIYLAKTKRYAKDRFHVFDRAVSTGQEMDGGRVADQNYVWLSSWQLENLNHNYVLPIDLSEYQRLRSSIAKALVPLLYIWFYATSRPIQKRYRDLCQFLCIRAYPQISRACEKLKPGLNELQAIGYLADWDLTHTVDGADFKLILTKGRIFQKAGDEHILPSRDDRQAQSRLEFIVKLLTQRGITERIARRTMLEVPDDQNVEDQIEWIDNIVSSSKGKIQNPPGLYIEYIRNGVQPPPEFMSLRKREQLRRAYEQKEAERAATLAASIELEQRYSEYRDGQITRYIEALTPQAHAKLFKDIRKQAAGKFKCYDLMPEAAKEELVYRLAMQAVEPEVDLVPIEDFEGRGQVQLKFGNGSPRTLEGR